MSAYSADLAKVVNNIEGAELNALFAAVLERRCATCRFRRRKLGWKSLEACLRSASDIPAEAAEPVRRFYVTPAHAEHMDDRFTSLDSYFCSLKGEQFHEHTRLTPQEFIELHERVAHRLEHPVTHRAPISSKYRLAIALTFLGHGSSFIALAHELKLGRSQFVVYECLSSNRGRVLERGFPGSNSLDVAEKCRRVQEPLEVSKRSLFRTSILKSFLERAEFPGNLGVDGVVDYHIFADGGFAQQSWMQRPFRHAEVTNDLYKTHFNEVFSSARRTVESVFGIIPARFRLFKRVLVGTEDHCKLIVAAALVSSRTLNLKC
ncbi:unnamed protein product [Heligmosomoides polygyrus]|uniref:DDE Tnp4 domain-containing protein n=1 Tax=Heligmosomoides polygyrus TaxID=6339 RepID=A0A183F4K9_HELPZ|nr:unnamed protein product [Heligmosomoides polygyrus]